jgi:ubiquinone/menaquinone biosynthesis C-methylase UbiE
MTNETATDEVRANIHRMWAAVAPSWGEYADFTDMRHAETTALMLELTDPRPGERVLELACGAGGIGLAAADRVGAGGEVVLSDVVAEMTEIAAARAQARRLTNTRTRILDLEAIDEPDRSFDVVVCRDGFQFATDPARAAHEIARIVRPGGRVALAVWGPQAQNPWLGTVIDAASAQLGRPIPPPGIPGPFALSDAEQLRGLLADAGLGPAVVTALPVRMHATSFDEWWTRTCGLAGPLAAILAGMSPVAAEELRARARNAAKPFETPNGLTFDGLALIAAATKPD